MTPLDLLYYVFTGAVVGVAVGMTGVGGGSLMTPMLLGLGFPLHTAVGTDLLFAAITKSGGAIVHGRQGTVRWDLVIRFAAGSLPATAVTILALRYAFGSPRDYSPLITMTLGVSLILTSVATLFKGPLGELASRSAVVREGRLERLVPLMGALLGVLVTLSSVGAGAIGTALLLVLFPRLSTQEVIGTGLAFAVPLTLFAGLGHALLGNVDIALLVSLLAGSLPGITVGARLARRAPEKLMRPLLASTLCGIGIKFVFF